jgi:hypothetical protein
MKRLFILAMVAMALILMTTLATPQTQSHVYLLKLLMVGLIFQTN